MYTYTSAAVQSSVDAVKLHYGTYNKEGTYFYWYSFSSVSVNFQVDNNELRQNVHAFADYIFSQLPASQQQLQQIEHHQLENEVCEKNVECCRNGWPHKSTLKVH